MQTMRRKLRRYGGAERPFEVRELKVPKSRMMVGRNSGSEAKETLVLKFERPNNQSEDRQHQ